MKYTLTFTRTIDAIPKAAYRAFTTSGGLQEWFCNSSEVDTRIGGRIFFWTNDGYQGMGKFTELEEDKLVSFDYYDPAHSVIKVALDADSSGTTLTLEQSEIDVEDESHLEAYRVGWDGALDNLKAVLETGFDKRLYDRPMLGVVIGGTIDKDNQARYGVPLEYGIIINDVVKGMGAEAVGITGDDVIVQMGEIDLKDFSFIQQAVATKKAGDSIEVVWYRGSEKHVAEMILSGRPKPRLSATPKELAEEVHKIYGKIDAELADIFEGVTQNEAESRPTDGEWNAMEILAHLILTERAVQHWVVNASQGRIFRNWASGNKELVASVVAIHPTIPHLLAEIRRTEGQTVSLLSNLPEDIIYHKGSFHNIVTMLNENGLPLHTRAHFSQIKGALASAKA